MDIFRYECNRQVWMQKCVVPVPRYLNPQGPEPPSGQASRQTSRDMQRQTQSHPCSPIMIITIIRTITIIMIITIIRIITIMLIRIILKRAICRSEHV